MTELRDDAHLREALQDCLARIEAGAAPSDALATCPDAETRARIAPLIAPALCLRGVPAIPADRGEAIRASLDQLAAELYPAGASHPAGPPPEPQAPDLPGGRFPIRLITIAAIGVGLTLIAWSTYRSGQPVHPPGAMPPSPRVAGSAATAGERFPPPLSPLPAEQLADDRRSDADHTALNAGQPPLKETSDNGSSSAGESDGVVPGDGGPPCSDMLGVEMSADLAGTLRAVTDEAGMTQITGRVVDGDCRPVPDAIVILTATDGTSEILARSEPDGTYLLAVPQDRYRAEILAEGYAIRGWFDGRSYREAPAMDVRLGGAGSPDHLDFVLSSSPTGGSR